MFITLDLHTNTLIVDVDPPLSVHGLQPATLDLATRGRLLGLEIDNRYIRLDDRPVVDHKLTRSVPVEIEIANDGHTILLPRSGNGWEIAFPSGNRCWRPTAGDDGALRCEVLIPDAPPD